MKKWLKVSIWCSCVAIGWMLGEWMCKENPPPLTAEVLEQMEPNKAEVLRVFDEMLEM